MESKSFIDRKQSGTMLRIGLLLIFVFFITFTFRNNILSALRHHPKELASQKNIQSVKIATAE